jgi:hypothetical protein
MRIATTRTAALVIGVAIVAFLGGGASGCRRCSPDSEYCISRVLVDGKTEHSFYHQGHHFMTLIAAPTGSVAVRPHPGVDPNGWGTTWYPQAFLPPGELTHASVNGVEPENDGIHVALSGQVSKGPTATYGEWSLSMLFSDDRELKEIIGTGAYTVTLDGMLTAETGDLNLYKIASNYLDNVPLLGDGVGDTGDMASADVMGGSAEPYDFQFTWIPPDQPAHYPGDTTDRLFIEVAGQYNHVDTAAQGYEPIQPAYKPSLTVALSSWEAGAGVTFGAQYDVSHSQEFWMDNVGITPLIRVGNTRTEFEFDVEFESAVLPGDGS